MTRDTSLSAYDAAMTSGMITRLEKVVYKHVYENQGATGSVAQYEVTAAYGDMNRSFGPRFATLVKRQMLCEVGRKIRSSTGREVLAYRTTDNLPIALPKPPRAARKILNTLISQIREIMITHIIDDEQAATDLCMARIMPSRPHATFEEKIVTAIAAAEQESR
jgi:hypothetical protein